MNNSDMNGFEFDFDVPTSFPNGLNLRLLVKQMHDEWSSDLRDCDFTANGKPSPTNGIQSGTLLICTKRALTADDISSANAIFIKHVGAPTSVIPGRTLDSLMAANKAVRHPPVVVSDVERMAGPNGGMGALVYSDGSNWRRASDDTIVR